MLLVNGCVQVKGKPNQQCVIKASIRPASVTVTDTKLVEIAAKEGSNKQAVGSTSKIIEGGKMAGEGGSSSSNIGIIFNRISKFFSCF